MSSEVNATLRQEHMQRLADCETAIGLYDRLCVVVSARPEGIADASQHLVAQIAELERIMELARADVAAKGIRDPYRNGRQVLDRENRSIGTIQRCIEQQRKLMSELRITPASRRDSLTGSLLDDGFADFR